MTTKTLRTEGNFELVQGFSAGWNVFNSETRLSCYWNSDSDWRDMMLELEVEEFIDECEALIQRDNTECAVCGEYTDEPQEHYGESFCSLNCAQDSCFSSGNPDPFRPVPRRV